MTMSDPALSRFTGLFDHYGRQARLFPALLVIFPSLLAILAWFPWLLISSVGATLLTLATSCGLLYALASWARTKGKRVESQLLRKWGAWPTTTLLRHSSSLDRVTRKRYHSFLSNNIPDLALPTETEEIENPTLADELYSSAVIWLKEKTRGSDFPMIERENAQYGFRRNLLGLKSFGLAFGLTTTLISIIAVGIQSEGLQELVISKDWGTLLIRLGSFGSAVWSALAINIISLIAWLTIVNERWVMEGGFQYANALLSSCDRLQQSSNFK